MELATFEIKLCKHCNDSTSHKKVIGGSIWTCVVCGLIWTSPYK